MTNRNVICVFSLIENIVYLIGKVFCLSILVNYQCVKDESNVRNTKFRFILTSLCQFDGRFWFIVGPSHVQIAYLLRLISTVMSVWRNMGRKFLSLFVFIIRPTEASIECYVKNKIYWFIARQYNGFKSISKDFCYICIWKKEESLSYVSLTLSNIIWFSRSWL